VIFLLSSGNYSILQARFKFRRRIQNFLLSFYIPSILTVMLSWVSFYITPNSAPARCALGIITVLAIGGFLTGQRNSFPIVSYVMGAGLYILVSYVFVAMALLEYAVVHFFAVYEIQMETESTDKVLQLIATLYYSVSSSLHARPSFFPFSGFLCISLA